MTVALEMVRRGDVAWLLAAVDVVVVLGSPRPRLTVPATSAFKEDICFTIGAFDLFAPVPVTFERFVLGASLDAGRAVVAGMEVDVPARVVRFAVVLVAVAGKAPDGMRLIASGLAAGTTLATAGMPCVVVFLAAVRACMDMLLGMGGRASGAFEYLGMLTGS